ncbi:MAG: M56 family metallopeptidase [Clostridiales bacterium]|nr:M56 family metallopeptidase [Clostridiales bacterium]
MIRYVIGITLIAAVIMIVRTLTDGKIRRKHQYALWIIIPVYMVLSPFLRINVPIAEDLYAMLPNAGQTEVYEQTANAVSIDQAEQEAVVGGENGNAADIVSSKEMTVEDTAVGVKTDWSSVADIIFCSVTAVIILALLIYNAGFILYCRKNRRYVARDPVSGLKIFGIDYKGTPFLLFNKIYVEEGSGKISKYVICHEASHYKHRDHIWIILRYLVLALNWYNPVIWAAFVLSGKDCELACDEEVIRFYGKSSSTDYAEDLFDMIKNRSGNVWGFAVSSGMRSDYKTLRKRILSIRNPAKKGYKALAASLAVVLVFSGCTMINPVPSKSDSGKEPDGTEASEAVTTDPEQDQEPEQSYPEADTVLDEYVIKDDVYDGEYHGRAYSDMPFVEHDGKQYILVGQRECHLNTYAKGDKYSDLGTYGGYAVYYTDEDISTLHVGDEFVYDKDIHFKIESLEVEDFDPWKSGYLLVDRANGKIQLNSEYCLIHGGYERDMNDNIIDDSDTKRWYLTYEEGMKTQEVMLPPVGRHALYEISDNCVFKYVQLTGWNYKIADRDDLSSILAGKKQYKYADCEVVVRKNKVVEVLFYVGMR